MNTQPTLTALTTLGALITAAICQRRVLKWKQWALTAYDTFETRFEDSLDWDTTDEQV